MTYKFTTNGRRFVTLEAAKAYAAQYHQETGVFVAIEALRTTILEQVSGEPPGQLPPVKPWRERLGPAGTVLRAPEHKVYTAMQAEIDELREAAK